MFITEALTGTEVNLLQMKIDKLNPPDPDLNYNYFMVIANQYEKDYNEIKKLKSLLLNTKVKELYLKKN